LVSSAPIQFGYRLLLWRVVSIGQLSADQHKHYWNLEGAVSVNMRTGFNKQNFKKITEIKGCPEKLKNYSS
jgi:hypothetical protein